MCVVFYHVQDWRIFFCWISSSNHQTLCHNGIAHGPSIYTQSGISADHVWMSDVDNNKSMMMVSIAYRDYQQLITDMYLLLTQSLSWWLPLEKMYVKCMYVCTYVLPSKHPHGLPSVDIDHFHGQMFCYVWAYVCVKSPYRWGTHLLPSFSSEVISPLALI